MPNTPGFTTVELVVVVAIAAIIAVMAVPALGPTIQRYRTRSAADQVAGELRRVQGLAMTTGTKHRLRLRDCPSGPTPCKQYRIEREAAGPTWPGVGDTPTTNADVLTEWLDLRTEYGGARITQLQEWGGANCDHVIYDARGASANTASSCNSYPLTGTVANQYGDQKQVQVRRGGGVRVQ